MCCMQTLLTDIEPAAKVKAAMNEINAATRLRSAAAQKAEADKIQVVKAAEADAEAKFLAGQGSSRCSTTGHGSTPDTLRLANVFERLDLTRSRV